MFANQEHTIDGQFVATATEGLSDGGIDVEANLTGAIIALVTHRSLVDVHRYDLGVWHIPATFIGISHHEAVAEVLRVGQITIAGGDDRQAFWGIRGWLWHVLGLRSVGEFARAT